MRKRILLFLIVSLFLAGLASAAVDTQEVHDTFQVDRVINYAKGCFNNGSYCSASAVCYYTFFDPSGDVVLNNVTATNSGTYHNYTYLFNNLGIYQIDMSCCDGNLCNSDSFYANVTGSGFNDTFAFYVIIFALSFGVIIFGLWKQDAPITILGTFGLYFLGIYILFNGIGGFRDTVYTRSLGIIVLGIAFYISAKSTYELVTD